MDRTIHVIGASGRSGQALCRALVDAGDTVVPVVRNVGRWRAAGIDLPCRLADLGDADALRTALGDAERVVSLAHARHAGAVLAASPASVEAHVLLGSTRKASRWPDAHGDGVRAGERAFLAAGRPGIMLHPTMIYGAAGEDNVRRLAALARRLPVLPLPDGGRALVQPIHQSDVTRAIVAALGLRFEGAETLIVAGARAIAYRDFAQLVVEAAGIGRRRVVSLPARPLILMARLSRHLPFLPTIAPDEMRRLLEDKAFDIAPMTARLGFEPMDLRRGLALTFDRRHEPPRGS